MQRTDAVECPFCLDRMVIENREGNAWLVCPNGCATEIEAPERKSPATEQNPPVHARAVGQ